MLKSIKGFTLPEILIAFLIGTLALGAMLTIFITSYDSWEVNRVNIELGQELRKAVDWMRNDITQSGSAGILNVPADGNQYTTMTFRKGSSVSGSSLIWSVDTVQYVLAGSNGNELRRIEGGNAKALAQNIADLHFRRQASALNIVEISLQASKNTSKGRPIVFNLTTKIGLRD